MGKALAGLNLLPDPGVAQGRLYLPTVPDDPGILQQALNLIRTPSGNHVRIKPLKSLTKTFCLRRMVIQLSPA